LAYTFKGNVYESDFIIKITYKSKQVFEPCCPAHIALHTVLFVLVILSN